MQSLRYVTRITLLELALDELIGYLRDSLDRNRRGDGSPSEAYRGLALALERFDRVGGVNLIHDGLCQAEAAEQASADAPDQSGAVRSVPVGSSWQCQTVHRAVPVGSGRNRTASGAGGIADQSGAARSASAKYLRPGQPGDRTAPVGSGPIRTASAAGGAAKP